MPEPDATVFVVEDDASLREAIVDLLASVGLATFAFGSVAEFLSATRPDGPGCLVLVGSSRVDLQACKLEYSIVSPK